MGTLQQSSIMVEINSWWNEFYGVVTTELSETDPEFVEVDSTTPYTEWFNQLTPGMKNSIELFKTSFLSSLDSSAGYTNDALLSLTPDQLRYLRSQNDPEQLKSIFTVDDEKQPPPPM